MSKHVAILGCGPAGLLVAHAAASCGLEPVIYSRKERSEIPGSQYLHRAVPGLTSVYPEGTVQYVRIGTADGYATKVYADAVRETGWDNYYQLYNSWNVVRAYDILWERYGDSVLNTELTQDMLVAITRQHPLVISTVPAYVLCLKTADREVEDPHGFGSVPFWIRTLPTPVHDAKHDIVVYNGILTDDWYRWSILSGICSIEYAKKPMFEDDKLKRGEKAIMNTCDCWSSIHRAGRWAEWRHGVLLNDAYEKAMSIFAGELL